jgi:hypothetical protein
MTRAVQQKKSRRRDSDRRVNLAGPLSVSAQGRPQRCCESLRALVIADEASGGVFPFLGWRFVPGYH